MPVQRCGLFLDGNPTVDLSIAQAGQKHKWKKGKDRWGDEKNDKRGEEIEAKAQEKATG